MATRWAAAKNPDASFGVRGQDLHAGDQIMLCCFDCKVIFKPFRLTAKLLSSPVLRSTVPAASSPATALLCQWRRSAGRTTPRADSLRGRAESDEFAKRSWRSLAKLDGLSAGGLCH